MTTPLKEDTRTRKEVKLLAVALSIFAPNKTMDECLQFAQAYINDINAHRFLKEESQAHDEDPWLERQTKEKEEWVNETEERQKAQDMRDWLEEQREERGEY